MNLSKISVAPTPLLGVLALSCCSGTLGADAATALPPSAAGKVIALAALTASRCSSQHLLVDETHRGLPLGDVEEHSHVGATEEAASIELAERCRRPAKHCCPWEYPVWKSLARDWLAARLAISISGLHIEMSVPFGARVWRTSPVHCSAFP